MSYQEERLQEIADAIREVKGTTEKIPATNFASEIVGLSVVKPSGIKTITENGDYDVKDYAWASVKVEADLNERVIIGKWGVYISIDDSWVLEFLLDKTFKLNTGTTIITGSYVISGTQIIMSVDSETMTVQYNNENDTIDMDGDVLLRMPTVSATLITKEITENGTYKASDDGADGYSEVVVNVAGAGGGGGSSVGRRYGEFRCVAIDYDGTILKEEWLNEGDVFELPEFPTHDRLVALEWSSPAPIVDNKITVWEGDVNAGVIYDTKSGLTEFDIVLTKATGLTVNLGMSGTKDWGDGTSDTTKNHTYSDYGEYTITCDGTSVVGSSTGAYSVFGEGNQYQCVEVRVSSKVKTFGNYAFANCYGLRHISFSNKITSWSGTHWFNHCGCLKGVIFPNGISKIGNEAFRLTKTVEYMVFPYGLTSIGSKCVQFDSVLDMAVFPDTMTSGGTYNTFPMSRLRLSNGLTSFSVGGKYQGMFPFNGRVAVPPSITTCPSDKYFADGCTATLDFSKHTVVPTMSVTSFLTSNTNLINGQFKIIVPDALYDEWIAATNWSTFANYIYKASEV